MRAPSSTSTEPPEPLGRVVGTRVRPTYESVLSADWRARTRFPQRNEKKLAPGASVCWRKLAWSRWGDPGDLLQGRSVVTAVFEGPDLASSFHVHQLRNHGKQRLSVLDLLARCDEISPDLLEMAEGMSKAVRSLADRDWLEPGEVLNELTDLTIPASARGSLLWPAAMQAVLKELAADSETGEQLCVLRAEPLELVWHWQSVQDAEGSRSPESQMSQRMLELRERRHSALIRLYERELGFKVLDGQWMGRVIATR